MLLALGAANLNSVDETRQNFSASETRYPENIRWIWDCQPDFHIGQNKYGKWCFLVKLLNQDHDVIQKRSREWGEASIIEISLNPQFRCMLRPGPLMFSAIEKHKKHQT